MWKKIGLLSITGLILGMLLAACSDNSSDEAANGNGEDKSDNNAAEEDTSLELGQKELTIPYVGWDSATASNHVIEVVLEEAGYDVDLKQVNSGAMYTSVADSSADATVCVWLPNTDADYWDKYQDDLVHLGPNIEGTPLGLVVPEYMDVDSIEDLKENKNSVGDQTEYTITGIEPGAGQMNVTREQVIPKYGLDQWELQASSSAAMAAALGEAIKKEEPIVVTLWSPHWAFAKWDLKFLEDPQNVYGDPDNINTIVRKNLEEDAPKAYKILDQFHWTKEQIGEVMTKISNGMEPADAAQEWVSNNQDTVEKWTEGAQ
ncbi:Glycine betaine-binding protein OpuAC [Lentibacillus sp. JNUCC-1]|uniref:glycine betaine ABC transporter substrate-binding protein n=1 Tax=Lentibacillus sp. JNUCC-1 TaxID=2654513 RepID=UPI0012E83A48|nr:glycine betaine ABC transporter substrate-binding protein [Lentibacillus sp. JNUCC-1]MUV37715.1 Glycine betaine-binding protein OpuAC [Lentibacillus sp. JNUCC-1]